MVIFENIDINIDIDKAILENINIDKGRRQKKILKSGQADRLGRPPLPRSGQENVKKSRQVVIFGVILPF